VGSVVFRADYRDAARGLRRLLCFPIGASDFIIRM